MGEEGGGQVSVRDDAGERVRAARQLQGAVSAVLGRHVEHAAPPGVVVTPHDQRAGIVELRRDDVGVAPLAPVDAQTAHRQPGDRVEHLDVDDVVPLLDCVRVTNR